MINQVFFRVDASVFMGTGHVMRCLTLADEVKNRGGESYFITREHQGHLAEIIRLKGHKVILLSKPSFDFPIACDDAVNANWLGKHWSEDATETIKAIGNSVVDWLIVDHYAIDSRWHKMLRPHVDFIFVIDDLADRDLDCDFLLDQNFYFNKEERYKNRVSSNCECLLGPQFALLREEYINIGQSRNCENQKIQRILVFMGGGDPTNETRKTIEALDVVKKNGIVADIVVGGINPHAQEIQEMCISREYAFFHQDIQNMASLMDKADLAIGAGGATTLERCYLGLPSLVFMIAENQVETTRALERMGALYCLGWHDDVSTQEIADVINSLQQRPSELSSLCSKSKQIMCRDNFQGAVGIVNRLRR